MDKSRNLLNKLRGELSQELESAWEISDDEVLEIIDRLLLKESKCTYLPIVRLEELRMELFRSLRKMDVLEELLENDSITEIMVNRWDQIFIEQDGKLFPWEKNFSSPEKLEDVIGQIASRCNRVINTLQPVVDARLPGGERVNAVIPPVALDGPVLTIRKFPREPITMEKLLNWTALLQRRPDFLKKAVEARVYHAYRRRNRLWKNNILKRFIPVYFPRDQRVITIEDNAELQLQGIPNLVRLECRQANIEKSQEITIGDLLKTCLRMRPSRIIVGEVRSGEAAQLLQAVNVGNDGSLSTIHANTCQDMVSRLETMVLMGIQLPIPVIRRQIVSGFDLFIHLGRLRDKSRKVLEISEIKGIDGDEVQLNPLFIRKNDLEKAGEMNSQRKNSERRA